LPTRIKLPKLLGGRDQRSTDEAAAARDRSAGYVNRLERLMSEPAGEQKRDPGEADPGQSGESDAARAPS
jgi:hypothetical protein